MAIIRDAVPAGTDAGGVGLGAVLILLSVLGLATGFQLAAAPTEPPVAPLLALMFSFVVLARAARDEDGSALVLAWSLRLLVAFVAYRLMTVPDRTGDWVAYDQIGWQTALQIRSGAALPAFKLGGGSENVRVLVGYLYAAFGHSLSLVVLFESALGFMASLVYLGTCRLLVPRPSPAVRYGLLFFPSFVFWTTLMGKDPVVSLGLALGVYGAVALCVGRGRALANVGMMAAGVCLCLLFRPYLVLIQVPASIAALLFGLRGRSASVPSERGHSQGLGRGLTVAAALVLAFVLAPTLVGIGMHTLGVEKPEVDALLSAASHQRASNPDTGGSNTGFTGYGSLADYLWKLPASVGTLLMRPFPWEVHNLNMVFAAADTLLIVGLWVWLLANVVKLRRRREPWLEHSKPAVRFLIVWLFLWASMFLNMTGNLGTMVRHRVQAIPSLLLLAAVVAARAGSRPEDGAEGWRGARPV